MDEARHINLGLAGAWGYGAADLTSPVQAAAQNAFGDHSDGADSAVGTELRVHGVGGSTPQRMLQHPHALQVGGDNTTMFFRRWNPGGRARPSVPWRLEAYSWGGLTESAWASSAWILLFPFMLYNLAHFALPPGRWQKLTEALIRLLALASTVQFVLAPIIALLNGIAYQAASADLPTWASGWPSWSLPVRASLAELAVAAVIGLVWLGSVVTARRYECRVHGIERHSADGTVGLDDPRFWRGYETVCRQRNLHTAAGLAVLTLAAARPGAPGWTDQPYRLALVVLAGIVLLTAAGLSVSPLADRAHLTARASSGHDATVGTVTCRNVLVGGVLAAGGGLFCGGWSEPPVSGAGRDTTLPGLTTITWWLLGVQVVLLAVIAVLVYASRPRQPDTDPDVTASSRRKGWWDPFAGGSLASCFLVLAVFTGGALTDLLSVFAIRAVGAPVPAGAQVASHAIQIPAAVYGMGLVLVGLLLGAVAAGVVVLIRWCRDRRRFARPSPSPIADYYADSRIDCKCFARSRLRVASSWATGLLVDTAGLVAGAAAAGALIAAGAGVVLADADLPQAEMAHGPVALEALVAAGAAAGLIWLLRADLTGPKRRLVGVIWDVATFWPRASHPLAPPCYAERAVPELVDRIRLLTGTVPASSNDPARADIDDHAVKGYRSPEPLTTTSGPVLLSGYSQGAVIAPAVIAQLPPDTLNKTSLLTMASPLRRLHGRAFPSYLGPHFVEHLKGMLTEPSSPGTPRWKNLVRPSDYIGSWVVAPLPRRPSRDRSSVLAAVDQPCWDPVVVAPDINQAPPLIHRHSAFWAEQRVLELGRELLDLAACAARKTHISRRDRCPRNHECASVRDEGPPALSVIGGILALAIYLRRQRRSRATNEM